MCLKYFLINCLGCELNRILTYYHSGPLRISSVSIIAERSDLENNVDDHKRSIIRGNINKQY